MFLSFMLLGTVRCYSRAPTVHFLRIFILSSMFLIALSISHLSGPHPVWLLQIYIPVHSSAFSHLICLIHIYWVFNFNLFFHFWKSYLDHFGTLLWLLIFILYVFLQIFHNYDTHCIWLFNICGFRASNWGAMQELSGAPTLLHTCPSLPPPSPRWAVCSGWHPWQCKGSSSRAPHYTCMAAPILSGENK